MTGTELVLVAVAGLLCGVVNSMAGGGSLLLFPALLATGMAPLAANVTNSVSTWPGYIGGVAGFRAELPSQRARLTPLVGVTIAGSVLGCGLLLATPTGAFDLVVPVLVLVASGLTALQPVARRRLEAQGPAADAPAWMARTGVFVAAIYGGYFGGALGVIMVAVLGLCVQDSFRRINAGKSVLTLVDATVSVVVFGLFGPVQWLAVAVAAPAALLGGYTGARIARRVNENWLRSGVVGLGVTVAIVLFIKA